MAVKAHRKSSPLFKSSVISSIVRKREKNSMHTNAAPVPSSDDRQTQLFRDGEDADFLSFLSFNRGIARKN